MHVCVCVQKVGAFEVTTLWCYTNLFIIIIIVIIYLLSCSQQHQTTEGGTL